MGDTDRNDDSFISTQEGHKVLKTLIEESQHMEGFRDGPFGKNELTDNEAALFAATYEIRKLIGFAKSAEVSRRLANVYELLTDGVLRSLVLARGGCDWVEPDDSNPEQHAAVAKEMVIPQLETLSEHELLQAHGAVIDELMRRKVVRTRNNPIGDYTEWLVCRRLHLEIQGNSKSSCDAIDDSGIRYQIKGRQADAKKVQFSAIRNLDQQGFDFVIAVVFDRDYSIRFAVKLPHAAVANYSKYRQHVNAHILILDQNVIHHDGVQDIAGELRPASN